jgi:hypothetical protein
LNDLDDAGEGRGAVGHEEAVDEHAEPDLAVRGAEQAVCGCVSGMYVCVRFVGSNLGARDRRCAEPSFPNSSPKPPITYAASCRRGHVLQRMLHSKSCDKPAKWLVKPAFTARRCRGPPPASSSTMSTTSTAAAGSLCARCWKAEVVCKAAERAMAEASSASILAAALRVWCLGIWSVWVVAAPIA